MPFLVRDYSASATKWVYWKVSAIPTAYQEYPSASNVPVQSLSGKLDVIQEIVATSASASLPESSVWTVDGLDLYPSYVVDGHTGVWAVEIRKQEIKNYIGVLDDGLDTEVAYNSLLSYKLDENGNISSETTFDGQVQGFLDDEGNVVFKKPSEYDIQDVITLLPSDAALPNTFVDILPSSVNMPDLCWQKTSVDIILK
jgi:hypothetical protein